MAFVGGTLGVGFETYWWRGVVRVRLTEMRENLAFLDDFEVVVSQFVEAVVQVYCIAVLILVSGSHRSYQTGFIKEILNTVFQVLR